MCECADVRMCEFFNTIREKEFAHLHIRTFSYSYFLISYSIFLISYFLSISSIICSSQQGRFTIQDNFYRCFFDQVLHPVAIQEIIIKYILLQ